MPKLKKKQFNSEAALREHLKLAELLPDEEINRIIASAKRTGDRPFGGDVTSDPDTGKWAIYWWA